MVKRRTSPSSKLTLVFRVESLNLGFRHVGCLFLHLMIEGFTQHTNASQFHLCLQLSATAGSFSRCSRRDASAAARSRA